jgi:hypothetical protein
VTPAPGARRARGFLAGCAALAALAAGPAAASLPGGPVTGAARVARQLEDAGAYDSAAVVLRDLRTRVAPDADLDLALALDLARSGALGAARLLLYGPVLEAALADSCPPARRRPYRGDRDELWLTGRFEGWSWYVARARAEVDARLGRWTDARAAAQRAVAERPLAGREWLVAAVCAGRAGDDDAAEREARQAAYLDPMLPEAHYLVGLFEWRAGRRSQALERFAAAASLDSLYEPSVRARRRLRFFPGAAPDSLPATFLTRGREAGLLASPVGPKLETLPQVDRFATVLERTMVPIPDSLQIEMRPVRIVLPILVDEDGRAVLIDLPWIAPDDLPAPFVALLFESLSVWRFVPAQRYDQPVRSWSAVSITAGQP